MYTLRSALSFLYRDFYVFSRSMWSSFINFGIIVPITLTVAFGYFLPNTMITNPTVLQTTTMFAGSIMWAMFPFAFSIQSSLLYDLRHDRFIDYQLTLVPAYAIVLERIIYGSIIVAAHMIFYFPLAKLIMGATFDTSATSWLGLFLIIYCGALLCSAYNFFVVNFADSMQKVRSFWVRVNFPLIQLGGFFFSWKTLYGYNKTLGYCSLLNPFTYITEGLRRALLGSEQYFPLSVCVGGLLIFSAFFTLLALFFFRRNVDPI